MSEDLTDFLLEIINDSGAEYMEPTDLISLDELIENVEDIEDDIPIKKYKNKIAYENNIDNYDIPINVTERDMLKIIRSSDRIFSPKNKLTYKKISIALTGVKRSEDTKKKISESMKNRTLSKEHKNRIKKSIKGKKRKPMSEETKQKIRETQNANRRQVF